VFTLVIKNIGAYLSVYLNWSNEQIQFYSLMILASV